MCHSPAKMVERCEAESAERRAKEAQIDVQVDSQTGWTHPIGTVAGIQHIDRVLIAALEDHVVHRLGCTDNRKGL